MNVPVLDATGLRKSFGALKVTEDVTLRLKAGARTALIGPNGAGKTTLVGLLSGKDVLVGAIDVATDVVETPEDVAATLRAALRYVPAERLYPCTNCGMVPLTRAVARAKLNALGAGAAIVRAELAG